MSSLNKLITNLLFPTKDNKYRGQILHLGGLLVLGVILLCLLVVEFKFAKHGLPDNTVTSFDQELLSEINKVRSDNDISQLEFNDKLNIAANAKLDDMQWSGYWDHSSPTGVDVWYFIWEADYIHTKAGENLARGFVRPDDVVEAWYNSPAHQDNLLGDFKDFASATKEVKSLGIDKLVTVGLFASPAMDGDIVLSNSAPNAPEPGTNGLKLQLSQVNWFSANYPTLLRIVMTTLLLLAVLYIVEVIELRILKQKPKLTLLDHGLTRAVLLVLITVLLSQLVHPQIL